MDAMSMDGIDEKPVGSKGGGGELTVGEVLLLLLLLGLAPPLLLVQFVRFTSCLISNKALTSSRA